MADLDARIRERLDGPELTSDPANPHQVIADLEGVIDEYVAAVRAVLGVHRPSEYTGICEECGTGMTHNLIPYHLRKPCPTVRAIARELGVGDE
ncbi:hypothetical protein [Saccharopolyspora mangrovi]|uniref:TraR/DksA family transcriptional regulator n=1 Tax=Saccharopolyspora mangrovi TaxID=3082379 RepID=A0ABU6A7A7_9PSEU|nr:hypothetical protein [Saccharopolyspora sp. S2-29]MEB3367391.1 hypothetical protein [Saccharopolyspora sp. S2-29]